MNLPNGETMPSRNSERRRPLFPLIRHLSARVTPWLLRTPVSANQLTAVSLVFGLAAVFCMALGSWRATALGSLLLVIDYILDNCDGEVARIKGQSSEFGHQFDTFVDWIVNATLFAALGYGVSRSTGDEIWLWLGLAAMAGATINYGFALYFERRAKAERIAGGENIKNGDSPEEPLDPSGIWEWTVFAFRELSRADFCFLVLILAIFDVAWVLVPLGAVGAQVYWMMLLFKTARKFHS